ncbi:MAG: hypothetical protein U0414_23735 [Polyangiaceae bacterium]
MEELRREGFLFGPSAAVFLVVVQVIGRDERAPPIVSRVHSRRRSTASPSASMARHAAAVVGFVTRGVSAMRVTRISCSNSVSHRSTSETGAALRGSAAQARRR